MWANIWAFMKALPLIAGVVKKVIDFFERWERSQISAHYARKKKVRAKLIEQLKEAETNEEKQRILELLDLIDADYSLQ